MPIDIAKIIQHRQHEREAAAARGVDSSQALELKYIADSLEAIRGEIVGIAHVLGAFAQRPTPR